MSVKIDYVTEIHYLEYIKIDYVTEILGIDMLQLKFSSHIQILVATTLVFHVFSVPVHTYLINIQI